MLRALPVQAFPMFLTAEMQGGMNIQQLIAFAETCANNPSLYPSTMRRDDALDASSERVDHPRRGPKYRKTVGNTMNSVRKFVGLVLAMALAVFALPALAHGDDEKFGLKVVAGATPGTFTATITNLADDDDRIKSFKIKAPGATPAAIISNAVITGGTGSYSSATRVPATISTPVGEVTFKNVNIRYRQTIVVTLTAALPGGTACGSNSYLWDAMAWEGSSASGETFRLTSSTADRTTSVSNACTIAFVTPDGQPANAIVGQSITHDAYNPAGAPLQVKLLNGDGSAVSGRTVNLAANSPNCTSSGLLTLTGTSATTDATGVAQFVALKSSTAGDGCALKASSPDAPSITATSSSLKVTTATLKVTAVPTSVAVSTPAKPVPSQDVVVKLLDSGGATIPQAGSVTTLSVVSSVTGVTCTLPGVPPVNATNGVATFSGLLFGGSAGKCVLKADATFAGVAYSSAPSAEFPVLAEGNLVCADDPNNPPPGTTIDGSPGNNVISNPGYAKGVRGANVKQTSTDCPPVNWAFTNNVLGGVATTDPKGNTVPVNGVSFVWDQAAQPNAAYSYTVTWKPERFGLASLNNRKTKFCTNTGCTTSALAQACLSPALDPSSLPISLLTPPNKDPACVSAEVWVVVPVGDCAGLPMTFPEQTACVVVTTTITDIEDPPIIRD